MKARSFLLPLFLLAGCAAPASEARDNATESASEVVAAPRPDSQHFSNVPKAAQEATIAAFKAANPELVLEEESLQVDELTGGLSNANNIKPLGAHVTQTAPEVVTAATAFAEKNAAALGLTLDDIRTADVEAKPYPFESGTFPWTVTFRRISATPGYEGFDTVDRYVGVIIDFSKDGTIGRIYNSSSYFPGLRISTKPALASNDPGVVQNIVGSELVWHDESFVPGPDQNLGRIAADDITSTRPVLHLAYDVTGFTLTLAYEISVTRGDHYFTFFVHGRTGAIIEKQQSI